LEVGFEAEMSEILNELPNLGKRILTSATEGVKIPKFVGLVNPSRINYLNQEVPSQLTIETVVSPDKDKLKTLVQLLHYIGDKPGIIFCNYKDSIEEVSSFLKKHQLQHGCFSGGLEQKDRERALIKFRNGSSRILVATDLAARGIDIPELNFIIHYELPHRVEEFTHRNGRTARVKASGTAYVLQWEKERLPEFIPKSKGINISNESNFGEPYWETLFISGGRKDKISKGDIAGLFFKQGGLKKEQLGTIELKQDCAFVAVPKVLANTLTAQLNNSRLKKKKVRITVL
jgi:superfamily II DNA/RNA helicase